MAGKSGWAQRGSCVPPDKTARSSLTSDRLDLEVRLSRSERGEIFLCLNAMDLCCLRREKDTAGRTRELSN